MTFVRAIDAGGRAPRERKLGFTVVEMLIVVALFGMVFLLIMEIFSGKLRTFTKTSESYRLQSGLRLLVAHLSMDVRGAVGFKEIKQNVLELYDFKNVPAPSRDWTDKLLDGETKTTLKIRYELVGTTMTRTVDGEVWGKYDHVVAFDPKGVDLNYKAGGAERFTLAIVDDPKDATGVVVHVKAKVEVKDKIEEVELYTKFMSTSRQTLRIYGMGKGETPFFDDRGGYFSPIDRIRTF
jgi:type II secretory pathway pseudopilin PulG